MSANITIYQPIPNKYYRWYESICRSRQQLDRKKGIGIYFENHHIIPTSLGGNNTKENKVLLTAKEHFIVHRLLPKFLKGKAKGKMWVALHYLTTNSRDHYIITGRTYNLIQQKKSEVLSNLFKNRPISEEQKLKISNTLQGNIPWNKGKKTGTIPWNKGLKGLTIGWAKGKKRSLAERQHMSEMRKGKKPKPESNEKNRQSQLGEKNHFFGKHHTPETIAKIRAAKLGTHYCPKNIS